MRTVTSYNHSPTILLGSLLISSVFASTASAAEATAETCAPHVLVSMDVGHQFSSQAGLEGTVSEFMIGTGIRDWGAREGRSRSFLEVGIVQRQLDDRPPMLSAVSIGARISWH